MRSRLYVLVPSFSIFLCISGCATGNHLRPSEREALQSMFGDTREPAPLDPNSVLGRASNGDVIALHQLFAKSLDPMLDGEYAETQTHHLARALFELGDHRFASALRAEPQRTRDVVLSYLRYVFVSRHLSYPQTESLSSDPDRLRRGLPAEPRTV